MLNMTHESISDWATPTLKEAVYWRDGMTPEEYDEEREYFGLNYKMFMDGTYKPLWAQREGIDNWK